MGVNIHSHLHEIVPTPTHAIPILFAVFIEKISSRLSTFHTLTLYFLYLGYIVNRDSDIAQLQLEIAATSETQQYFTTEITLCHRRHCCVFIHVFLFWNYL